MKFKLTHNQLIGLNDVFTRVVLDFAENSFPQKLYKAILVKLYEKIYRKMIFHKKQHSLTMTEPEALAFLVFFQFVPIPLSMYFEANLIGMMKNEIHKKYL